MSVTETILNEKIIAIVRENNRERAIDVLEWLHAGGMKVMEVSLTTPSAIRVISKAKATFGNDALVGVGTVLTVADLQESLTAGADFVVCPNLDREIVESCMIRGKLCIPGVFSVTEIREAIKLGCKLQKFFPAEPIGPEYIRAVRAPFPEVKLIPTGGINLDNAETWLKAGAVALGVGGSLTRGSRYEVIERANQLIQIVEKSSRE